MNVPDPTTRPWSWLAALLVLLTMGFATRVEAQVLYGSIVGNVRDSSGGILPGAAVTITHHDTRATRETVTRRHWRISLSTVQTGTYTFVVKMTGFQSSRATASGDLNTVARVDAALSVEDSRKASPFRARTPLLQTDRAEVREELRRASCRTCRFRSAATIRSSSHTARLHAAGRCALDSVQPVPRADVQRERREPRGTTRASTA